MDLLQVSLMDLDESVHTEATDGEAFSADDILEDATFSDEVCVICTGVVTERGVLDCCQHWFCYECIEQWAAFSNHCPICKIDFHSITFLPVDDTNDCVDDEESSLSIEGDEWYLKEGDIDTLYFPANYINEENVRCLDGGGCRIQSGLATYGDSITDTSVACDSCENWYHAICVNFDPNCSFTGGWICPRCASDTGQLTPVLAVKDSPIKNSDIEVGNLASSLFPGDVSVSVDDGETAVVVSFHKGTDNYGRGKESESNLPLKDSEKFLNDEKFPLVLSPVCEHISEESMPSGSNSKIGTNEGTKIELCEGPSALENKTDIVSLHDHHMADSMEKQEAETGNLAQENLSNVFQQPIELRRQTTKRRYSDIMMEPVAVSKKTKTSTDIMTVVTDQSPRSSNKEKVNAGVRTRKIMRNKEGENKPIDTVDKLQSEINTLKDSINDDSLLKAVRAVIVTNKAGPSVAKPKRPAAQTGKARQNLMKKIYSTSTGRRRPAWQRDCEVEFWRYRCNSKVDQEKIENLQSILDLLKKGSSWSELCQVQNEEKKESILSRVYLADASVLPRKDDLKPLSDVSDASAKSNQNKPENGDKSRVIPVKKESKITVGIGLTDEEKKINKTGEVKVDKKKWALEVLARKNASLKSGSNQERSEDGLLLKGNFPLLAKLPVGMRPVLASVRHNKVPISVRQAQLYRVAEHFLRRTNLSSICQSAETELAVADAVNIEKEICERSNSKLVYLNLISQSVRHNANKSTSDDKADNIESTEKAVSTGMDGDMEKTNDGDVEKANDSVVESANGCDAETSNDSDVEKLLRMAGLLSDSPPNSPERNKTLVEDISSIKGEAGLVDNKIIEMQGKRVELNFECIGNDHPERERDEEKLENNMDSSSVSDYKEDSGIPKDSLVVVKTSENEAMDKKRAPEVETGNMKTYDENKNANKHTNDNNDKGEDSKEGCESEGESCAVGKSISHDRGKLSCSPTQSMVCENALKGEKRRGPVNQKLSDAVQSISEKVEAYVKEHIRPLCKSGVITVRQYRWAVGKTVEKVMKYHQKDKNANFLIKEGDKVKKLAEQYVEAAQNTGDV